MDTAADVEARLPIRSDMDLAWVRQHVRQAATRVGFGLVDQTKLVTAASELARNTLVHGGGGVLETTRVTAADGTPGLRLTFSDEGPGIPDLDRALSVLANYVTGLVLHERALPSADLDATARIRSVIYTLDWLTA